MGKIEKADIVEKIAQEANITKTKANQIINIIRDIFKEAYEKGDTLIIRKFLKAKVYETKEKTIKIPRINKILKIPKRKKLKIVVSRSFFEESDKKNK